MKSKKEVDYRKANPESVYELKKVALRLRRKGKKVSEICEITGLADQTVRNAFKAYDKGASKRYIPRQEDAAKGRRDG